MNGSVGILKSISCGKQRTDGYFLRGLQNNQTKWAGPRWHGRFFFFPASATAWLKTERTEGRIVAARGRRRELSQGQRHTVFLKVSLTFFPLSSGAVISNLLRAGRVVGGWGQKKPAVVGSGWFRDFQGQFLVGWNKKDASESIPSIPSHWTLSLHSVALSVCVCVCVLTSWSNAGEAAELQAHCWTLTLYICSETGITDDTHCNC